jgi:hypothetical protein
MARSFFVYSQLFEDLYFFSQICYNTHSADHVGLCAGI